MNHDPVRFDLPGDTFPVTIEALHPESFEVVWTREVSGPEEVYIPPLRKLLGHPVAVRIRYGDGTTELMGPPPSE